MPLGGFNPVQALLKIVRSPDVLLTAALFGTVFLLVLPVPPMAMDMLLAISIGMSLFILLIVLYVKDPPEFSIFPTILLTVTLFRLGLNVASTRLILLDGYAGEVINSFGHFVVRGNYVVGTVVFLILVIINFIVITKGSGRIAEVAARFTLDAMPGKQMAIDAELNAGMIDEVEAGRRRMKVQKDADFYGSMDGASKFVRGDAIAGILITLINVVGGILIGVFQRGLELTESLEKYTLLSIGDGLVSQIPSLIISVGAGILVTRSTESTNLGKFIGRQFVIYPKAVASAGVMMLIFAIMPGMPMAPFMVLACACGGMLYAMKRFKLGQKLLAEDDDIEALPEPGKAGAKALPAPGDKPLSDAEARLPGPDANADPKQLIKVDVFAIEMGFGLLGLADASKGGDLVERITGVRKTIAQDLGIILPPIAIRDNLELDQNDYRFLLRGKEIARNTVIPNRFMAMNVNGSSANLKGVPTIEPVFGLEAVWINESERKSAEINGFTVVDPSSVLITHLSETLRENAYAILEREDVQRLIDLTKENNPTLISELLPDLASVGLIQRVLRGLLKEKVPVRNLTLILETIADFASFSKNPDDLAEQVRRRLGPYFIEQFESEPGRVRALTLEPRLEQFLVSRVKRNQFDANLMLDPATAQHLLEELTPRLEMLMQEGLQPLIVTTAELRLVFRRFFEPSFPRLGVIAYQELPNAVQIENAGVITAPANLAETSAA